MSAVRIIFNNEDLAQVAGLSWVDRPINDTPTRNMTTFPLARANKAVLTNAQYLSKTLSLRGLIVTASRELTEQSIDMLKSLTVALEAPLDIEQSSQTRRYFATLKAMTTNLTGALCEFTLQFEASDPIGYDTTITALLASTAITVPYTTLAINAGVSYDARPVITVTVTSVTGGTAANVTITSGVDNIGITVNRTWAAGDILEIDSYNQTVLVNKAPVNFTGRFPIFAPGGGSIGYSDQFTTRNISIKADYTKRYI